MTVSPLEGGVHARRPQGARRLLPYAVALLVIALDQLSKWWVLGPLDLPAKGQVPVLPPVFNLTLVHNAGVSFGLLRAGAGLSRWGLSLFSVAVAAGLGLWARRVVRPWTGAALGLVMGGALGNVVDRVRQGYVTDFLDVSGLHFPWVFNIADSAISIGVAMLVLESVFPAPGAAEAATRDAPRNAPEAP